MSLKKVIEKINKSKSFLITAHMNLEGDALGSELAVYMLLKKLKKRALIYNNDPTPAIYNFLPNSEVIKNSIDSKKEKFDVAIFLDCSDSSRAGKVKDNISDVGCIINIDHHISNTYFGDINWVDPKASSATQIIYNLCDNYKVIDRKIALCLYTGIFVDTGNFTYANTTPKTHRIASNLLKYNIVPSSIYENIHSLCTKTDLNFIGKIMQSLKIDSQKNICWVTIPKWEEKAYDLTEIIFSIMRLLNDVEVLVLFKKINRGRTRINFRSRSRIDVNRIAKFFGGGGHKRASGTTVEYNLEEAEKKVIPFLKRYTNGLKPKRTSRV